MILVRIGLHFRMRHFLLGGVFPFSRIQSLTTTMLGFRGSQNVSLSFVQGPARSPGHPVGMYSYSHLVILEELRVARDDEFS